MTMTHDWYGNGATSTEESPAIPYTVETSNLLFERFMDWATSRTAVAALGQDDLDILEAVANGSDAIISSLTHEALTLCISMKSLNSSGLSVLVCPTLESLRDRFVAFSSLGVKVASFDLILTKQGRQSIWDGIDSGRTRLLLVSPGRLASTRFRNRLAKRELDLVAIDQAHLMSSHSWRFVPSLQFIGKFTRQLQSRQRLAFCPFANVPVQHDVTHVLGLKDPVAAVFTGSTNRETKIEVMSVGSDDVKLATMESFLGADPTLPTIVYCSHIRHVFEVVKLLDRWDVSHATIRSSSSNEEREKTRRDFELGKTSCILVQGARPMECNLLGFDAVRICFMGLTDSVEDFAASLFAPHGAKSIESMMLCNEVDFYQHRFLIDKNYPDLVVLRSCYEAMKDAIGNGELSGDETLLEHVRVATPHPDDDIRQCIDVLFREGVITQTQSDFDETQLVVKRGLTEHEEFDFWHEYPLRKHDRIARLQKVREFVSSGSEPIKFMTDYLQLNS